MKGNHGTTSNFELRDERSPQKLPFRKEWKKHEPGKVLNNAKPNYVGRRIHYVHAVLRRAAIASPQQHSHGQPTKLLRIIEEA